MNKENQNLDTYFLNSKTYDLLKELLRRIKNVKKN